MGALRRQPSVADSVPGNHLPYDDHLMSNISWLAERSPRTGCGPSQSQYSVDFCQAGAKSRVAISVRRSIWAGGCLVLCLDGLWAYFDAAEMGAIIAEKSARDASETLISLAGTRAREARAIICPRPSSAQ